MDQAPIVAEVDLPFFGSHSALHLELEVDVVLGKSIVCTADQINRLSLEMRQTHSACHDKVECKFFASRPILQQNSKSLSQSARHRQRLYG